MHHSIREEFDFLSDFLSITEQMMTEQEAQTNWHQDFTGTCAFYFSLKERKEFFFVEPTARSQQRFDEWQKSAWKKFVKM